MSDTEEWEQEQMEFLSTLGAVEWKSAKEIDPDCVLFADVAPEDIWQGYSCECWFLSSLASLAEHPAHVQGLIKDNGDATYTCSVYSYESQAWNHVTVTDTLPVDGSGQPVMNKITESKEIWSCIYQKAFALHAGGYTNCEMGNPEWAMGALTGCHEIVEYDFEDEKGWGYYELTMPESDNPKDYSPEDKDAVRYLQSDELMDELVAADKAGYLMAICTEGHARTLLKVVKNPGGAEVNLLQVRDQIGDENLGALALDGTWGQPDGSGWTDHPEVTDALSVTDDDGVFWISLEDCVKVMKYITVCKKALSGGFANNCGPKCIVM